VLPKRVSTCHLLAPAHVLDSTRSGVTWRVAFLTATRAQGLSQHASASPSETRTRACTPPCGNADVLSTCGRRLAEHSATIPCIREHARTRVWAAFLADWAFQPAAWLAHRLAGCLAGARHAKRPCACIRYSPQTPYPYGGAPGYGGAPAGRRYRFSAFVASPRPGPVNHLPTIPVSAEAGASSVAYLP